MITGIHKNSVVIWSLSGFLLDEYFIVDDERGMMMLWK